jgi:hypothetical protein
MAVDVVSPARVHEHAGQWEHTTLATELRIVPITLLSVAVITYGTTLMPEIALRPAAY